MAGVLLPFLKWFIGGSGSKGPKILNFLVRSPWSTIDVIGQVDMPPILYVFDDALTYTIPCQAFVVFCTASLIFLQ